MIFSKAVRGVAASSLVASVAVLTTLSVGIATIHAGAHAAPIIKTAADSSSIVTGPDPLALSAAAAIDAWIAYSTLGQNASFGEFIRLRDFVAADAATRIGIDPVRMQAAWRNADRPHQLAVLAGFTQLGVPYHYLGRTPGGSFDCSGLTSWAWEQAGTTIPRASRYQINGLPAITMETAQAGDLVYYPSHVMLYLGVDYAILQSPRTGRVVTVANVWSRKLEKLRWANPLG